MPDRQQGEIRNEHWQDDRRHRPFSSLAPQSRAECRFPNAHGSGSVRVWSFLRCWVQGRKPIACTLDAGDFRERAASIHDLARRSLRHASRMPLTLGLTYEPKALDEVRDLVAKEKTCCAFLTFDLTNDARGVFLTITAPPSAAEAADLLFDHFAPELAASNLKETA
jgi:hypothetical protein